MYITAVFLVALTAGSARADPGIKIPLTRNDISSYHVNLEGFYQGQSLKLLHRYNQDSPIQDTALPLSNVGNVEYYAPLDIGNPSQTLSVLFDTGSADLWIPSSKCHFWHIGCWFHNKYHSGKSSTYREDGRKFNIQYVTGVASGYLSRDSVSIGNLTVQNQTFAEVTSLSKSFFFVPFDGICGLAFPSISASGENPPFVNMMKQRLVDKPFFSIYLTKNTEQGEGGEIRFAGTKDSYYKGKFTFVSILKPPRFWAFILDSIAVGASETVVNNVTAIVDSGTSLIAGPPGVIRDINNAIGAKYAGGLYVVENCDDISSLPNVIFTINNEEFILTPQDYILEVRRYFFFKTCVSGFMEVDLGTPIFILGNVFMRKVYVQFNNGHGKLGFAHVAD